MRSRYWPQRHPTKDGEPEGSNSSDRITRPGYPWSCSASGHPEPPRRIRSTHPEGWENMMQMKTPRAMWQCSRTLESERCIQVLGLQASSCVTRDK